MKQFIISLILLPISLATINQLNQFNPASIKNHHKIQILFAGDMMLDRHIRQKAQAVSYDFLFNPLTPLFNQVDTVVVNLEGSITTNPSISLGSLVGSPNNYTFTFDPQVLPALRKNNIGLVNLGNNHILNFGNTGLDTTTELLSRSHIDYFGNTGKSNNRYKILTLKGKQIAFVNYNQFVSAGLTECLDDISQVKKSTDLIIVYAHWGIEYQSRSNLAVQTIAHQLIDAGADLIIGSHPHVVQETEIYNGKTIYYSLGNFIFDQYFMTETQQGLLVKMVIDINAEEIEFINYPVSLLPTGQTTLIQHDISKKTIL